MKSNEITKADVLDAMQKLHRAAKNDLHESLMSGEPPDSAYNIHVVIGTGSLETIDQFRGEILAEMCKSIRRRPVKIAIDPKLPKNFNDISNEDRPKSHHRWWYKPFITTKSWQNEVRYDVRCLDGGAWDRSTFHGTFTNLEEALIAANNLAESYEPYRIYCRLLYPARLSGGFHFEYTKVFRAFPKLANTESDDYIIFNDSSASFRNIVATPVRTGR